MIGAVTFFAALIVQFPARLASSWFVPDNIQLTGVRGTLWHGSASEGQVTGLYIHDLNWQLKPWTLLLGKLAVHANSNLPGGFLEGDFGIGIGGVSLRNVSAALPLATFDNMLQLNGVRGEVSLQLARADLDDGWPTLLTGNAGVSDLLVRNLAPTPLGSYRAEFQTEEDGITGSVEDSGGILDLAGSVRLMPDRTYSFIGRVGPTADAPASVTEQLSYLGTPDARGLREFRFEGSL